MKAIVIVFNLTVLLNMSTAIGQGILINPPDVPASNYDLPRLVNETLSSECVVYRHIVSVAEASSFAYFENGNSDFPFERGVLFSTGIAELQSGPNNDLNSTTANPSSSGGYVVINEILDDRIGNTVNGRNSISTKFSFISQSDRFSLRYIFASESYQNPENIECFNGNNQLQDGFAILIKGPGISPDTYDDDNDPLTPEIEFSHSSKNIALLPDGVTEVGLHSVHDNPFCSNIRFPEYYHKIPLGTGAISANGRTVPLVAEAPLIQGEEYTVEIVLTNRGDHTLDSSLFIEVGVEPLTPSFQEKYYLCVNEDGLGVSPFTIIYTEIDQPGYSFNWYLNDSLIVGENESSIIPQSEGTYTVEIIGPSGCSRFYSTTVVDSSAPIDFSYTLKGPVFTNDQTLTVSVTGKGTYLYQLDNGEPQKANVFENISPGTYNLTIFDINSCGSQTFVVMVLDYPRFFTPNNDGINDYWNIDFEEMGKIGQIYILDRYGKLITEINSNGVGWDGTFLGRPLPSSDYWFVLNFNDGQTFKSHFTLKR